MDTPRRPLHIARIRAIAFSTACTVSCGERCSAPMATAGTPPPPSPSSKRPPLRRSRLAAALASTAGGRSVRLATFLDPNQVEPVLFSSPDHLTDAAEPLGQRGHTHPELQDRWPPVGWNRGVGFHSIPPSLIAPYSRCTAARARQRNVGGNHDEKDHLDDVGVG